jgi:hypothetical protein
MDQPLRTVERRAAGADVKLPDASAASLVVAGVGLEGGEARIGQPSSAVFQMASQIWVAPGRMTVVPSVRVRLRPPPTMLCEAMLQPANCNWSVPER